MSRHHLPIPWLPESTFSPRVAPSPVAAHLYTPRDNHSFYGSSRPSAAPLAYSYNTFSGGRQAHPGSALSPYIPRTHSVVPPAGRLSRHDHMANWNMVWLQPKTGTSASFDFSRAGVVVAGAGGGPAPGPEQLSPAMEKRVEQLCRPTLASAMKRETPWMKRYHVLTYMDADRVAWSKQELRKDCESRIWTDSGTVRSQTKI